MSGLGEMIREIFIRGPKPLPECSVSNERIDDAIKDVEEAAKDLRHTSRNEAIIAAYAAAKLLEPRNR